MPDHGLPQLVKSPPRVRSLRSCPAHRAWVRKHYCCVPGCKQLPIECAHVRTGTGGGTGLKPTDRWCISLCCEHHAEQHLLGERRFGAKYDLVLSDLAEEFFQRSPHRRRFRG